MAKSKVADEVTEGFIEREAAKARVVTAATGNGWPFRGCWDAAAITEAQAWFDTLPNGEALMGRLASGIGRMKVKLRQFDPEDSRVKLIADACDEADTVSERPRAEEDERWRRLYSGK